MHALSGLFAFPGMAHTIDQDTIFATVMELHDRVAEPFLDIRNLFRVFFRTMYHEIMLLFDGTAVKQLLHPRPIQIPIVLKLPRIISQPHGVVEHTLMLFFVRIHPPDRLHLITVTGIGRQ